MIEVRVDGLKSEIKRKINILCHNNDQCFHLLLFSMFSLICPVNHSIPSCRPSPVVALLAQMCQGLSNNLSKPEIRPADEIHCKTLILTQGL